MFAFSLLLPFRAQTFRGKRWEEEGEKEEGRKLRVWEEPQEGDQIFACEILLPSPAFFLLGRPMLCALSKERNLILFSNPRESL